MVTMTVCVAGHLPQCSWRALESVWETSFAQLCRASWAGQLAMAPQGSSLHEWVKPGVTRPKRRGGGGTGRSNGGGGGDGDGDEGGGGGRGGGGGGGGGGGDGG